MTPNEAHLDRDSLVAHLAESVTSRSAWRVGIEYETLIFDQRSETPVPFAGTRSLEHLLQDLCRGPWQPVLENDYLVGASAGGASYSLEPGGQLEYASRPHPSWVALMNELRDELARTVAVASHLDLGLLGLGFAPTWESADVFWVPRSRYALMRPYLQRIGPHGVDMMGLTCAVQLNFDYASEADMVRRLRVAAALQPVVSALVARSPFCRGRPSGYRSFRGHVWTQTDPARCGIPDFFFEDGMGFERYVDYALDVPMFSVKRGGVHLDLAGQSFRDFLTGDLAGLPGERPTRDDWNAHLNTLMPEARLKQVIELRGADCGRLEDVAALTALWMGILYDTDVLAAAHSLIGDWTPEERRRLWREAPRHGLELAFRGRPLGVLAGHLIALAREGLSRSARSHQASRALDILAERAQSRRSPADDLLRAFEGPWEGSVTPAFTHCALDVSDLARLSATTRQREAARAS